MQPTAVSPSEPGPSSLRHQSVNDADDALLAEAAAEGELLDEFYVFMYESAVLVAGSAASPTKYTVSACRRCWSATSVILGDAKEHDSLFSKRQTSPTVSKRKRSSEPTEMEIDECKPIKEKISIGNKLQIVEESKITSINQLAKKYGVSRSCIRELRASEDALRLEDRDAYRLSGAGRKLSSLVFEGALADKILSHRASQLRVTRLTIKTWATEMKEQAQVDVKICMMWVSRFMERHDFVLREATRKPVLSDDEIVTRDLFFVTHLRKLMDQYSIQPENIYNLDETAVFFDHSKNTTVHQRGSRDVPIRSYGLEKHRITAVFCASAAGVKKKPCWMLKDKPSQLTPAVTSRDGVVELNMGTSWMSSAAFIKYIDYEFPLVHPNTVLLIFDSTRSHIAADVKKHLQRRGILYAVIPGGMTGHSQPADFSWFEPLKAQLAKSIDAWKENGPFEYARGNRVKPPSRMIVSEWLKESWNAVSQETIRKSFTLCALGDNTEFHLARHERFGRLFLQQIEASSAEVQPSEVDG